MHLKCNGTRPQSITVTKSTCSTCSINVSSYPYHVDRNRERGLPAKQTYVYTLSRGSQYSNKRGKRVSVEEKGAVIDTVLCHYTPGAEGKSNPKLSSLSLSRHTFLKNPTIVLGS